MSRRARQRRFFLLVVLLTACVFIAIALLWVQDRRELSARQDPPVRLDITFADTPKRTLLLTGNVWMHGDQVVDAARLTPLLELLATRHRVAPNYVSADVDLAGAGLDVPHGTLTLTDANGRQTVLSIGAQDVSGQRRYVQEGNRVMLLPDWIWPLLRGGL